LPGAKEQAGEAFFFARFKAPEDDENLRLQLYRTEEEKNGVARKGEGLMRVRGITGPTGERDTISRKGTSASGRGVNPTMLLGKKQSGEGGPALLG